MNKKLFSWKALAGFALLAAISMTSCNTDDPINPTNPSGVNPTAAHYVGGEYDWTVIAKNLTQLQDFWNADKDKVAQLLKDNNAKTANIFIDVTGFELDNTTIFTLPNFWGTTVATNGKVVNITFRGNFKNADFERANAIEKNDVVANMTKFPVRVNTNTLKGAEVNFKFEVEKFDLYLDTREARSTLSGEFAIGYMLGVADVTSNDAIEVKSGLVEGLDMTSTGKYKGNIEGVWTKTGTDIILPNKQAGIKLNSGETVPGSKNVFVEDDATVNTWYYDGGRKTFVLGTVKYVKAATVYLSGEDAITLVKGFDASKCKLQTAWNTDDLDNIAAIEKTTVLGSVELIQDVYTDVVFNNYVNFSTKVINTFENVTFNALDVIIPQDGVDVIFNSVNFYQPVSMISDITVSEVAKTQSWEYQWIIDNTDTGAGHFEEVTSANPLTEANKDKTLMEYDYDLIHYDGGYVGASQLFVVTGAANSKKNAAMAEANTSFRVKITRTWKAGTTYIPEDVDVILDDKCKFSDNNVTGTGVQLAKTNLALNYVWGNKTLYDEQCWYDVNYAGVDYFWKRASGSSSAGTWTGALWVLTAPAAE